MSDASNQSRCLTVLPLWPMRGIAAGACLLTVLVTHYPPSWLTAIPLFHIDTRLTTLARQTGGYALLTTLTALARPLGRARAMHLQWVTAALLLTTYVYVEQWTVTHVDAADAPRKCLGVLLGLAAGMAGEIAPWRAAAFVWFWRTILIAITPPCLMMAFLPGYGDRLFFLVPVVPGIEVRADFLGHGIGALLATVCVMESRLCGMDRVMLSRALGVMVMLIIGPALELVQGLVGRGQQWGDVIAHWLGVLIAVAVILAIEPLPQWWRRHRQRAIHRRHDS